MKFTELNEAYGKMKGIKNKPDFIDVYTRVSNLVGSLALQRETVIPDKEKSR